jgi:hypothetical protein
MLHFFRRVYKMSLAPQPASQTWGAPAVVDIPVDWDPRKDGAALLVFS